jgi:copper resistance protein B
MRRRSAVRGAFLALLAAAGAGAWPGTLAAAGYVPPNFGRALHDDQVRVFARANRLEWRVRDGRDSWLLDGDLWAGNDRNKVWLKATAERAPGADPGDGWRAGELQLLYSRMVSPFWDVQAGVRNDFHPHPSRAHAVLGVQGVAPMDVDVEAAAFVSEEADVSARVEATWDLLLTQRLIATPRVEANASAQDVSDLGLARGVNDLAVELRLRYEVIREVAPYVGVSYVRKTGATAGRFRAAGGDPVDRAAVFGVRLWY